MASPYPGADLPIVELTTDGKHSCPSVFFTIAPFDLGLATSTIYQGTWPLSHPPVTGLLTLILVVESEAAHNSVSAPLSWWFCSFRCKEGVMYI